MLSFLVIVTMMTLVSNLQCHQEKHYINANTGVRSK